MTVANWKTQPFNNIQSLLFNNPHRVIRYLVRDDQGNLQDRAERPAPVTRLYEIEASPERTRLQTIQFVHHMLVPPGGKHVNELHIHPDAEEIVAVTRGQGTAVVDGKFTEVSAGDVIYVAPGAEHEFRNTSDDLLGVLFICVPTGEGIERLLEAQSGGRT